MNKKYKNTEFYIYDGINENPMFKVETKLPALLFFKAGSETPVELSRYDLLSCVDEENQANSKLLDKVVRQFI